MWHRAKPRTLLPLIFSLTVVLLPVSTDNSFLSFRSNLSFEDHSASHSTRCTADKTVAEDQEVLPGMPDRKTAVPVLAADHPDKDDVILRPHPGFQPTKPSSKTFGRFHHIGNLPQTCWTITQCMACHSLAELSVPAHPGHWNRQHSGPRDATDPSTTRQQL